MTLRLLNLTLAATATLMVASIFGVSLAQAPDEAKPSVYAPQEDLIRQVNSYLESLKAATADASEYNEDKKAEVNRDANTLAAIALVLGMHDQDNPLKPAAAKLIAAATHLAAEHDDAQKAADAIAKLKAIIDKPEKGDALSWKPAGDMVALMKQVPIVNNNLRRSVTSRRFAQSTDKNAALAATLAAIAQASMLDTDHIADEADRPLWVKTCAEMRDGSAEVLQAVRKGDQAAATKALDKIVKSCDDCHHKFRD